MTENQKKPSSIPTATTTRISRLKAATVERLDVRFPCTYHRSFVRSESSSERTRLVKHLNIRELFLVIYLPDSFGVCLLFLLVHQR